MVMRSQELYQLGRMMLERTSEEIFIKGSPDEVCYECVTEFDPAFALSMPGRVISLARYKFSSGFSMSGHGSDTYDLLYIFDGSITVTDYQGEVTISREEALFLHSCDNFKIVQTGKEPLDILILRSNGSLSASYYEILTKKIIRPIRIENSQEFAQLFEKIVYYFKYPTNSNKVLVFHTLSRIFVELYMNEHSTGIRDQKYSHPQWFVDMLAYIDSNNASDIAVGFLAANANMSESHFYKVFKEYTGFSPHQYLIRVRIQHAQVLLTTTDEQIKCIARMVGFNSVNHFIHHFKRLTGSTPLEYRERCLT